MADFNLKYEPKYKVSHGVVQYETPNDAYIGVLLDFLTTAKVSKRKGRFYLTLKPVVFSIADLSQTMIMLPGSNYHDPIPWLFAELFDWLSGPLVAGGQSIMHDKHRRTVYPRANGEDDWSYKSAFGLKGGEGQLDWARRHLRMDASSRGCIVTPWKVERDLIKYTARKELEVNKGEEYQRLPCISSMQFSTDDTSEDKKGLNSMIHQRALDFTGAAHTDIYRIAEAQHWLATNSIPNGHAGSMTVLAGTCVIESYGAGRFVEFGRLMEWWCSDKELLSIADNYSLNNICFRNPSLEYTPSMKTYDWFMKQWQLVELCVYNSYKNQWSLFEDRLTGIQYEYYKDFCLSMAVFNWLLMEDFAPDIRKYHWDAKQILEALQWGSDLNEYPPFHWLKRIDSWMQYFVSVELARKFIVEQDWERLEELWDLVPVNSKLQIPIMMDASRFLGKRQRDKLFSQTSAYTEFQSLYDQIFAVPEET